MADIISFKKFLAKDGLYLGDINSQEADEQFIAAIKLLENMISESISNMSPSAPPNSASGLIWQNNQINSNTSVDDIEKALVLIEQRMKKSGSIKAAQDTLVDQFDAKEYYDQYPTATKPMLTQDETLLETGDPIDSQQIGKSQQLVPETIPEAPKLAIDGRVVELAKLLRKIR